MNINTNVISIPYPRRDGNGMVMEVKLEKLVIIKSGLERKYKDILSKYKELRVMFDSGADWFDY